MRKSSDIDVPMDGAMSHSIGRVHAQKVKSLRQNAFG